jgi:hypothetical protein
MHTRGDVIAYKKFAKALLKGDRYILKNASTEEEADRVLSVQEARLKDFVDTEVVFTYYRIKDRTISADGKLSQLVGEQVSRVNPIGADTIWGDQALIIRQVVTLVMKNNAWKVQEFADPAMTR